MTNTGHVGGMPLRQGTRIGTMAVYDALPQRVRRALAECAYSLSPHSAEDGINNGYSADDIVEMIKLSEAATGDALRAEGTIY